MGSEMCIRDSAGTDAAGAQRTEVAEQPLLPRVAENRGRLARFESEFDQAHANVAHDVAELAPGQGLPESVGFLAEDGLVTALFDGVPEHARDRVCLLYTSDAADERSSVDLGGRRIITKKNEV